MLSFNEADNYLQLGEEEIVFAAPADSESAARSSIALADFANEEFVLPMPGSLRALCDGMFAQVGFEPCIVMENQSYQQVLSMVALGFGYALVPSMTWFSSVKQKVTRIPLSDVRRTRKLYLKWREGAELSEAACLLRDYLAEQFAQRKRDR